MGVDDKLQYEAAGTDQRKSRLYRVSNTRAIDLQEVRGANIYQGSSVNPDIWHLEICTQGQFGRIHVECGSKEEAQAKFDALMAALDGMVDESSNPAFDCSGSVDLKIRLSATELFEVSLSRASDLGGVVSEALVILYACRQRDETTPAEDMMGGEDVKREDPDEPQFSDMKLPPGWVASLKVAFQGSGRVVEAHGSDLPEAARTVFSIIRSFGD